MKNSYLLNSKLEETETKVKLFDSYYMYGRCLNTQTVKMNSRRKDYLDMSIKPDLLKLVRGLK